MLIRPRAKSRILSQFVLSATLLVAAPAYAQFGLPYDNTYRDVKVQCMMPDEKPPDGSTVPTQPPCPKEVMPMKDTPLKSFIKDFSPLLYAYARDKNDKTKPYTGDYYRGTVNDPTIVLGMLSDEDKQTQQTTQNNAESKSPALALAHCKQQIKLPSDTTSTCKPGSDSSSCKEEASAVRMQLDNCTNQYILRTAEWPYQKENTTLLAMEDPNDRSQRISLQTNCQPLAVKYSMGPLGKDEYKPSDYLKDAWIKLLQDPKHRRDAKAPLEPHYPDGLEIQNAIPFDNKAQDLTLAAIASIKYEEILDPSHPYTPRWDFENNERDLYSPQTSTYSEDKENDVYCAGVRQGDKKLMAKVDILSFRRDIFDRWISDRIAFNKACYENLGSEMNPCCVWHENGPCTPLPCWQCYGRDGQSYPKSDNKDGSENKKAIPPCPTNYSSSDLSIIKPCTPTKTEGCYCLTSDAECGANPITQKKYLAPCTNSDKKGAEDNSYHQGPKIEDNNNIGVQCKYLRAPVDIMNKVKMRYHNPDDKDNDVLPQGVPEGLTFKEYFKDPKDDQLPAHMPYPKLWDLGTSIQKTYRTDQDPMDMLGQWTAIVGVGHEAQAQSDQNSNSSNTPSSSTSTGSGQQQQQKIEDERCLYGGWGEDASFGGITIKKPDGITSWTELKLYQSRALRDQNISCIHRYEKAFKPGDSESLSLFKAGGDWNSFWVTKCSGGTTNANGQTTGKTCTYKPLTEAAQDGTLNNTTGSSSSDISIGDQKPEVHNEGYRGYLSTRMDDKRFPKFCTGKDAGVSGLDNAECGDIIVMPQGATQGGQPGLAKVGYVTAVNLPNKKQCGSKEASNCTQLKNCYVDVIEFDNGKFPDTCGSTDTWGTQKARRMYKVGMLDANAKDELQATGWTTSCEDTKIAKCEMKAWDSVKVYRIKDDYCQGKSDSGSSQ